MAIHRPTASEALPLKERAHTSHRPTDSTASALSAGTFEDPDPDVSPFADPGAAAANPFADPSPSSHEYDAVPVPDMPRAPTPAARPPHAPTLSFGDAPGHFAPFSDYQDPKSPTQLANKEVVLRSPVSAKGGYYDLDGARTRRRRRRLLLVGGIVLAVLVVLAIIIGVVVSKKRASSGGSGPLPGTAGVVSFTNTADPSTWVADGRLNNSFYGLGYTPAGAYLPDCTISQNNVTEDIVLLSQLTSRLRLYGSDCGQAGMVLEAIQQTKVDLQVYLTVNLTLNTTSYYDQATDVANALRTYGPDNVAGVLVGNQFIASYLAQHNTSDPNSNPGANAAIYVSSMMASMRASISSLNLSKVVPVGTADGGNMFTPILLEEVDFAMASVMPWRSNVLAQNAAVWTTTFFKDYALSTSQATSNDPPMYIGETGWPSSVSPSADPAQYPGATPQGLQTFLDGFVCSSNGNGTQYFVFEAFDEAWREGAYGGVEGGWGLFTSDKQLKNITLPSCGHV